MLASAGLPAAAASKLASRFALPHAGKQDALKSQRIGGAGIEFQRRGDRFQRLRGRCCWKHNSAIMQRVGKLAGAIASSSR
jgi:hypothetical protein